MIGNFDIPKYFIFGKYYFQVKSYAYEHHNHWRSYIKGPKMTYTYFIVESFQ